MKNLRQIATLSLFLFFCLFSEMTSAQLTPREAIVQMQKGINLGNTHEPPYEAGWNNPRAQEYYFDLYKDAGFSCVRIPVRWDNYTEKAPPYAVDKSWLNRIEQVAGWGLERGLFVIINAHHDDWIKQNYSEANKARFDSIWTQIAEHFKDKPDRLIFEILNEPHGLNKAQNDDMHGRILSIIRKSNPARLVIFQGHNWGGSAELLTAAIPDDKYVIGSFHSYDPYLFGLEGQGTWGTSYDYSQLENKFKAVAEWSETNDVPVLLGEFGALSKSDYNSRMRHYRAYVDFSLKYGFAYAAWDDGGDFRIMERQQKDWNELKDILIYTSPASPVPSAKIIQDSIISINWGVNTTDHDSIILQRKLGTQRHYSNLAVLEPETTQFDDIKPGINSYYNYRVIAHYNDSMPFYSQPIRIFFPEWTRKQRSPFYETPMVIPGVIEAEDFDHGGEGLAYHDANNFNIPGKYRPDENVDIYDRLGDGYHVGNVMPGEWLEYTVNVQEEGWYTVTSHIASIWGGGKFQINVDTVFTDEITVPASQSALNTLPVSSSVYLFAGEQIMRLTILSHPDFNIDKMVFEKSGVTAARNISATDFTAWQDINRNLIITSGSDEPLTAIKVYTLSGLLIYIANNPERTTIVPRELIPTGALMIQSSTTKRKSTQKIIIR